jgi:peptidoglycan-associated lipoprotein
VVFQKVAEYEILHKPIIEDKNTHSISGKILLGIFDDYSISEEAKGILKINADWLSKNENIKVQIEGHCDERGSAEYNIALGERRAKSAKNFMIQLGIDPSKLSTISYGKERPRDPGHNEDAWAKNRRDEFVVK